MTIALKAEKREVFGKKTDSLRRAGQVPAELYGHDTDNLHLAVAAKDFRRVFDEAGGNVIVDLEVDGEKYPVLIHDTSIDPLSGDFKSVDFYKVKMNEEITSAVPLEFTGVSAGVKDLGGILVKAMDEVEVEALPANLPKMIEVDISGLTQLGQSLFVKDIPVRGDFKIAVDPETVIVTVSEPKEEEVEVAPPTVESVVVETEEKKAEREAKQAAAEE
ncbi:MAG: 50S ribosomal protein L25 [Patescibacteria group bacterium]|nr:50S ribosomal protein L25 [Patescibacteria group bacterium]MCL5261807.1 50S ribosomal protein L25 [Patescibacteria group bacterium]